MAATLPREVIQSVLLSTDPDTFFTARQACRSWRDAGSSSYVLRKALEKTPTSIPGSGSAATEQQWNDLFNRVAHLNLLGRRDRVTKKVTRRKKPSNWSPTTVIGVTRGGRRLVALTGSRASIYKVRGQEMELDSSQTLPGLWTLALSAMTDSNLGQQKGKYRIAVATQGSLVAIGLSRTIQIYALSTSSQTSPVEYTLCGNEALTSLEFVDDDCLLRVGTGRDTHRPDGENRVRYLGRPLPAWSYSSSSSESSGATIEYWRQNIDFIYADSSTLSSAFASNNKARLHGLQILPRSLCANWTDIPGRFFAVAIHHADVSRYCIGFVPDHTGTDSEKQEFQIWRELPSRMDRRSKRYRPLFLRADGASEDGDVGYMPITDDAQIVAWTKQQANDDRWAPANMPDLTTSLAKIAVSDDGRILAAYERGAGHALSSRGGAVYVYGLEGCNSALPGAYDDASILPWSFLLDVVDEDVDFLHVTHEGTGHDGRRIYRVGMESTRDIVEWTFS